MSVCLSLLPHLFFLFLVLHSHLLLSVSVLVMIFFPLLLLIYSFSSSPSIIIISLFFTAVALVFSFFLLLLNQFPSSFHFFTSFIILFPSFLLFIYSSSPLPLKSSQSSLFYYTNFPPLSTFLTSYLMHDLLFLPLQLLFLPSSSPRTISLPPASYLPLDLNSPSPLIISMTLLRLLSRVFVFIAVSPSFHVYLGRGERG